MCSECASVGAFEGSKDELLQLYRLVDSLVERRGLSYLRIVGTAVSIDGLIGTLYAFVTSTLCITWRRARLCLYSTSCTSPLNNLNQEEKKSLYNKKIHLLTAMKPAMGPNLAD